MSVRGSKGAERSASSSFARTTFFGLKDGEASTIRFLTDFDCVEENGQVVGGRITVDQHQNVTTKPAPADFKGVQWPSHMTAICRNQDLGELGIESPKPDCFHCLSGVKKTPRTWALAVLREEVREGGKTLGFRDIKREQTVRNPDGTEGPTVEVPAIVVINLGQKNFFGALEGYYVRNGTILDQDFAVKRKGAATDTVYNIIGLGPITIDDAGTVFDLRDPQFMKKYLPDAEEVGSAHASEAALIPIIADRMSDEYYAKFFDTRVTFTQPSQDGGGSESVATSGAAATVVPAPSNDLPTTVDMAALRARITDHGDDSPQAVPAAPAPAAVAPQRVQALD
jgi:hypothetical protein